MTFTQPLYVHEEAFHRPLILAGKAAFLVLSRKGELSLPWHRWGATTDYGGLYAPPQRVTGPVRIGVLAGETPVWLGSQIVRTEYFPGYATFHYETDGFRLEQTLFVPERHAGAALILNMATKTHDETVLPLTLVTETWLSSIDFDGILPENPRVSHTHDTIVLSAGGLYGAISSSLSFHRVTVGGDRVEPLDVHAIPAAHHRRTRKVRARVDVPFREGEEKTLIVALGASSERRSDALKVVRRLRDDWRQLLEEKKAHYAQVLRSTVTIATPDRRFDQAFKAAVVALEALKAEQPQGICGVYAGYPWFAGFWGRDTGWTLPALLAIGEFEWAKRSLDAFLKHQARHDYDLLDASKGEVPMLHGYKTTFLYGSADSTLYFPSLLREYIAKTGDRTYAKRVWPRIVEMIDWGFRKDSDADGLIENRSSAVDYFVDATWMDTEDRRMKAIEVESLWARALESASEVAELIGEMTVARAWRDTAGTVKAKIRQLYWNDEAGYFHDTIRPDGTPDSRIRPNAMVALMYGHASPQQAQRALTRIERGDMTTEWGVRTLSSADPTYNPEVYHSGAVWPLVTGWTALAEYAYGRPGSGAVYLTSMARRIADEGGMYAEAYKGEDPVPHTSCILQAWSMSMFLQSTIEGLFGITTNALRREVTLHPQFPPGWERAEIRNIPLGKTRIHLRFQIKRHEVEAENRGEETIRLKYNGEVIELNAKSLKKHFFTR